MHAGCRLQVLPAHDVRHALQRVVDHDREMIAGRRLLAPEHDVAPRFRLRHQGVVLLLRVFAGLDPGERAGALDRRVHVEPQRVRLARHARRALVGAQRFGGAGIERRAVRIARPRRLRLALGDQPRDLGAALEARIDEALRVELRERLAVGVEMPGLAPHRLFPGDAEPGEVFQDRRLVFGPAARRVDILDAQQQAPARRARHLGVEQRRERVAEMQVAVRRRREAENGLRHVVAVGA